MIRFRRIAGTLGVNVDACPSAPEAKTSEPNATKAIDKSALTGERRAGLWRVADVEAGVVASVDDLVGDSSVDELEEDVVAGGKVTPAN